MNILISAAATAQAYQLFRFLDTGAKVFFGDSHDLPNLSSETKAFIKIPPANVSSFSHLLLTICLDHSIDTVYPLRKAEVLALAEARQLFDEYGIKIMSPQKVIVENLLQSQIQEGKLTIIDNQGEEPDRGVFLAGENLVSLKLFTAD